MATRIEAELAIDEFMDHLRGWLVQQPQWKLMMGSTDRATRRTVAGLIAKEIVTIPTVQYEPGTPNRALRRAFLAALEKRDKEWLEGIDL